jgi:hypothetical protein
MITKQQQESRVGEVIKKGCVKPDHLKVCHLHHGRGARRGRACSEKSNGNAAVSHHLEDQRAKATRT